MTTPTVGRLAIVLHTHMPWVLGYGTWPVGEEWLRQAWAHAYLPMFALLRERAERGLTHQLTLGVTPVLAAQWDDRASVHEQARWIADWHTRASGKALEASRTADESSARDAQRNYQLAITAARELDEHWSAGGSAALRPLVDSGLSNSSAGHSPTPSRRTCRIRSSISRCRPGSRTRPLGSATGPRGCGPRSARTDRGSSSSTHATESAISWSMGRRCNAPAHRCASRTESAIPTWWLSVAISSSPIECGPPTRGYPGDPWYLDFHSFDHAWGMRSYRVTDKQSDAKAPYEPHATAASIDRDVDDFISTARTIMLNSPTADPVIVAAYDTELFGHWWHEGPAFLARLLDKVPEAGIELTTLSRERSGAADSPRSNSRAEVGEAVRTSVCGKKAKRASSTYVAALSKTRSVTTGISSSITPHRSRPLRRHSCDRNVSSPRQRLGIHDHQRLCGRLRPQSSRRAFSAGSRTPPQRRPRSRAIADHHA